MEPEHIIDETTTIEGADIEKVYDDCIDWLKSIKGVIREWNRPSLIRVYHNYLDPLVSDTDTGWNWHPKNLAKYIVITLTEQDRAVLLRFIIERPRGFFTQEAVDKYRRWWILFLVGLFKHLKLDEDLARSRQYISKSNLEKMRGDIRRAFLLPFLFSLIMGVVGIYLLMNGDSVGAIFMIGGLFVPIRVLYEDHQLKKRLQELYPDR
jgi:hypothetical protein